MLTLSSALTDPVRAAEEQFRAHIETGKPQLAEEAYENMNAENSPLAVFCLALAWQQQDNAEQARQWKQRGIELLNGGEAAGRLAARLLSAEDDAELTTEDALELSMGPQLKALVLLLLAEDPAAEISAAEKERMLKLASKLNAPRTFPYHFLRKSLERAMAGS